MSSDAGRVGSMGETVYAACKAGVIGFTKSLAREMARHAITVNAVCPGPTETHLLDEVRASARGAKVIDAVRRRFRSVVSAVPTTSPLPWRSSHLTERST